MADNFLRDGYEINKPNKIDAKEIITKKISDTNFFSNLGTPFTNSTSATSGITESIITPGIRFLNFGCNVMKLYKNLQHNFNTIKNKVSKVEKIISAYGSGDFSHVRRSIVKNSVK